MIGVGMTKCFWTVLAVAACLSAPAATALDTPQDSAIAALTDKIRQSPGNAYYYNNRGLAYMQKGDFDHAIADFNQAMRLYPMKSSAAFNNRAMAYAGKGQYDRALADFKSSIGLDAKNAWTFNNRGLVLGKKGDARKAIADYSEAIRLSPRYVVAYQNRASAFLGAGDRKRARADLEEAARLQPSLQNDAAFIKARQEAEVP
ncbi:tetratricopeptide repeat protein [Methylobacterium sp. E-016]|uniref:tetratricopeptide repeat protein n=1 Tax=Methylobacterium sp. E-016 TaxID=2836556 RepID=UPI001FBBA8C2|nr:tetratricopeptide repeat protein [Methylobacterium sp. E-016]MCJ2076454.1 tetratricopeptide repeat protein [Methylobacterium sp. E-016]